MRLDKFLFDEGLMSSRSEAQAAIAAGKVLVNGQVVTKASFKISPDDYVEAEKAHPFVSRAALKLQGALEQFPVAVNGKVCLDLGASTGGFSQVLIEAGAEHVYAIDVGRDQFHKSLRDEPRISLFEQTDAREISEALIPLPIDLIVCDASFIGLEKVLLPALHMTGPEAQAVLLFKPQFQVGPKHVGKGGIVTDEAAVDQAKSSFQDWLEQQGWLVKAWAPSPITGSDGNQEWLVWACRAG